MQSSTTITGRIANDPVDAIVIRNDKSVVDLRIAVQDHRLEDDVRYIQVSQWGDAAHRAVQYLRKGRWVTAEGLLDARAYTDKNGDPQIGWTLKRAHIEFGPNPNPNGTDAGIPLNADGAPVPAPGDDIPF